jgi:hypothetical protein
MCRASANRILGILLVALFAFRALPADAESYVSPHSWFGFPGTMLNDEKAYAVWFPKKPSAGDQTIEIKGATYAQKSYLLLVGFNVFYVHDYDFSGTQKPYETYVGYLKENGMIVDSDVDESSAGLSRHHLRYRHPDGKAPVEMRAFEKGSHLYAAAVVANDKFTKTGQDYSDRFLNSLQPYDPNAEAK